MAKSPEPPRFANIQNMALFDDLDLNSTMHEVRGHLMEHKHPPLLARVEKIMDNMDRIRSAMSIAKPPPAIRVRYILLSVLASAGIGFLLGRLW